jgi:hypothetical protein
MRSINTERSLQMANSGGLVTSLSCSTQPHTNSFLAQKTYASSPSISEWNRPTQSSEFEEGESGMMLVLLYQLKLNPLQQSKDLVVNI